MIGQGWYQYTNTNIDLPCGLCCFVLAANRPLRLPINRCLLVQSHHLKTRQRYGGQTLGRFHLVIAREGCDSRFFWSESTLYKMLVHERAVQFRKPESKIFISYGMNHQLRITSSHLAMHTHTHMHPLPVPGTFVCPCLCQSDNYMYHNTLSSHVEEDSITTLLPYAHMIASHRTAYRHSFFTHMCTT